MSKAMPTDKCKYCFQHYWFYTKIRDDYFCGNPVCSASGDDSYHKYQINTSPIPKLPTDKCIRCGRIDWHPYELFADDFYCAYCWDHMAYNHGYSKQAKQTSGIHKHIPGMTPIRNPKKENKIFVICRDCGEDIKEFGS